MTSNLIPFNILHEIKDNIAFELIFIESATNKLVVDNFNRLNGTNLNFELIKPKSVIDAMIINSTGYTGINAKKEDLSKFIVFIHDYMYLPMVSKFNEHEGLNND